MSTPTKDQDGLDLEDILEEFGGESPAPPPEAPPVTPPAAVEPPVEETPEEVPELPEVEGEPVDTGVPRREKKKRKKAPEPEEVPERGPKGKRGKMVEFPEQDHSLTARFGRVKARADAYADRMFPDDVEQDPEVERQQELLPGVDYEDEPTHAPVPRRRRRVWRPKPDLPPLKLAAQYKKGLKFLHARSFLALLVCIPQLWLTLYQSLGLPMLPVLAENLALRCQVSAAALGVSALLGLDVLWQGLKCLLRLRPEGETVLLVTVAAALADALTIPILGDRGQMPYCGVAAVILFFALWGRYIKRRALRQSCRAAGGAAEPYRVTLDEKMWNGADAYAKHAGESTGFGSQVQEPDGAQRAYRMAAPILILAAGVLALLASVGTRRPTLFFWCLSAILTAGCGFSGFLVYAMPFSSVTRRLSKEGAALGNWEALRWSAKNCGVVLTDVDLFPPGTVTLNGIKLCGELPLETCVSYTATLVRETGSGMDKPFSDLIRTQGTIYRKCAKAVVHEGGVSGVIAGQNVLVGSGAFMEIMRVAVPQGLKVKNAVFCAVEGRLQAIFALNYKLHPSIRPALEILIAGGLKPILATRDFLIIPDMLRQRFKLPVDKMEFPGLDRRRELSSPRLAHDSALAALLSREGLGPYAEAVVGGKRLVSATRWGLGFSLLGSGVGVALATYLTASLAISSLDPGTMLVFLVLWLVPAVLISGWAARY